MKKIFMTISVNCFFLVTTAQSPGIHFEQGLNWTAVRAKAKKENKYIFVNCYTTWCKPCSLTAEKVFPLKESGDSVNPNFISMNMQMDVTEKDSDPVKAAYGEAHSMMTKYGIQVFPTYLFFTPDGKLVHRVVGSSGATQFISSTRDALEPDKQYYSMMDQYYQGGRDTVLLELLAISAFQIGDHEFGDSVLGDLLPIIKNPFTKNRLDLIGLSVKKPDDPGFELFLHNAVEIDRLEKPEFAETIVRNAIIRQNPMILDLFNDHSFKQSWDNIYNDLNLHYGPAYAHRIIVWIKVPYYKNQRNWELYGKSLLSYLKEYGDYVRVEDLNNYAWDIFEYCTSSEDLDFGLSYSLRTIATIEKPNPEFIDTYANLLYKSGKISNAIAKETEALELAGPLQKKTFKDTLSRMKAGQKTWE
jgi:thiol-disulfide isomerase/thioredoxin